MINNIQNVLQFIHFSVTSDWNIKKLKKKKEFNFVYPLKNVGSCINRVKENVYVQNEVKYKRLTIKINGGGVFVRDEVYGADIRTKQQYLVSDGQLAVSKIDARNGAFGLIPKEGKGAIVTGNFWVFDIDKSVVLPEYLVLIFSSKYFTQAWLECSNGSGNRLYLQATAFLDYLIPVPSLSEQKELVEKYNQQMQQAEECEKKVEEMFDVFNQHLIKELKVSFNSLKSKHILTTVKFSCLSRWDTDYLLNDIHISSMYPMCKLSKFIVNFLTDNKGRSLRKNTKEETDIKYNYIGMENIEKNSGKASMREVFGSDILSQTFFVPQGYILYGKLRPYLNKFWENTTDEKNIICSSEFFVFDLCNIRRDYFMAILSSDIIQKQLSSFYTGVRMPRITEDVFLNLQIPVPNEENQKNIAKYCIELRKEQENQKHNAFIIRQQAQQEFEEAVFSET